MTDRFENLAGEVERSFYSAQIPQRELLTGKLVNLASWEIKHLQSVASEASFQSSVS